MDWIVRSNYFDKYPAVPGESNLVGTFAEMSQIYRAY